MNAVFLQKSPWLHPSKQGTSPERSERPFRSAVRPHCNVHGRTFGGRPHLVLFLTFAGSRFEDVHIWSSFWRSLADVLRTSTYVRIWSSFWRSQDIRPNVPVSSLICHFHNTWKIQSSMRGLLSSDYSILSCTFFYILFFISYFLFILFFVYFPCDVFYNICTVHGADLTHISLLVIHSLYNRVCDK